MCMYVRVSLCRLRVVISVLPMTRPCMFGCTGCKEAVLPMTLWYVWMNGFRRMGTNVLLLWVLTAV